MKDKEHVTTIENRWDILYAEYPEVYDAFISVERKPDVMDVFKTHFQLEDKHMLDIGSGSGDSTFQLAKLCRHVTGIEIEDAMREIADQKLQQLGLSNVDFIKGTATDLPFDHSLFDGTIAMTLPLFIPDEIKAYIKEAIRVTKDQGYVINLGIAPKCYGGNLASVILGDSQVTEEDTEGVTHDILVNTFGFEYFDYEAIQNYDSVDHMVKTYGFIFGQKAIDYIIKHQLSSVVWTYRVHYKRILKTHLGETL